MRPIRQACAPNQPFLGENLLYRKAELNITNHFTLNGRVNVVNDITACELISNSSGRIGGHKIWIPPNQEYPPHSHPAEHLIVILEGSGFAWVGHEKRCQIGAGDVFHVSAGVVHQVGADSQGMQMIAVSVDSLNLADPRRFRLRRLESEDMESDLQFNGHADVYPPMPATMLLARSAVRNTWPGCRFLELGTGSGAVAITVSKEVQGAFVTATDLNPRAAQTANENAIINGVAVEVLVGDLFEPVTNQRFDVIAMHPPAVPYPPNGHWGMSAGMTLATNGGPTGAAVTKRFLEEVGSYLNPGGKILLLLPHWSDIRPALDLILANFKNVNREACEKIQFFPANAGSADPETLDYVNVLATSGVIELHREANCYMSRASVITACR